MKFAYCQIQTEKCEWHKRISIYIDHSLLSRKVSTSMRETTEDNAK